jgi:hypothetical protein
VRGGALVRARAQALVQLAATGVDGLRLPEVFPRIHALVTSAALALGRRLPQARRAWDHAQKPRCPCLVSPSRAPTRPHAQARGEAWGAAVTRWASVRLAYRRHLERGALIVHPWRLVDATRQRAPEGERQVHAESNALAA